MHKPTAPHIFEITKKLRKEYKDFVHYNKKNPLDELVFILCSVKRSEKVYLNAYRTLKRAFPKYEMLADTPVRKVSKVVAWGGLQNQKAVVMKEIINRLIKSFGRPTLAPLKKMPDEECERFLTGLPGVGKKVARCVMMYSLCRQVFPVDANCWRISYRLGWLKWFGIKKGRCSNKGMDMLQTNIPSHLRSSLHVNMVSHGREICKVRNPNCIKCAIKQYCLQLIK